MSNTQAIIPGIIPRTKVSAGNEAQLVERSPSMHETWVSSLHHICKIWMPRISAFKRWRQENQKLRVILNYISSSRPFWTAWNQCLKINKWKLTLVTLWQCNYQDLKQNPAYPNSYSSIVSFLEFHALKNILVLPKIQWNNYSLLVDTETEEKI